MGDSDKVSSPRRCAFKKGRRQVNTGQCLHFRCCRNVSLVVAKDVTDNFKDHNSFGVEGVPDLTQNAGVVAPLRLQLSPSFVWVLEAGLRRLS